MAPKHHDTPKPGTTDNKLFSRRLNAKLGAWVRTLFRPRGVGRDEIRTLHAVVVLDIRSGSRGELRPPAPTDPDVTVSRHPAPGVCRGQEWAKVVCLQWKNKPRPTRVTRSQRASARRTDRRRYLLLIQARSLALRYFKTGSTAQGLKAA